MAALFPSFYPVLFPEFIPVWDCQGSPSCPGAQAEAEPGIGTVTFGVRERHCFSANWTRMGSIIIIVILVIILVIVVIAIIIVIMAIAAVIYHYSLL